MLPFVGRLVSSKPYKTGNVVELRTVDEWYILSLPVLVPDLVREAVNTQGYVRVEGELETSKVSYLRYLRVDSIERAV